MLKENLQAIRKSKGLSQQELAVKAQCRQTDHIEMGKGPVCSGFRNVSEDF